MKNYSKITKLKQNSLRENGVYIVSNDCWGAGTSGILFGKDEVINFMKIFEEKSGDDIEDAIIYELVDTGIKFCRELRVVE